MKKLLSEIEALEIRKDKIAVIDDFILKNDYEPGLLEIMAKTKYLPEGAVKSLILNVSDLEARDAIKTLEVCGFNPDRNLLFNLIDVGHHEAAAQMIQSFSLVLTKSELMSIANKGGAESIITAIALTPAFEVEMIETLLRAAVSDDLNRTYRLIKSLYRSDLNDSESVNFAKGSLQSRATFMLNDQLKKARKADDLIMTKKILADLDTHNKDCPYGQLFPTGEAFSKGGRSYSYEKEMAQSTSLLSILSDPLSSETEMFYALKESPLSDIMLTSSILDNLISHEMTFRIRDFKKEIKIPELKKILKLVDVSDVDKATIIYRLDVSNKEKIELANKNNLIRQLYAVICGSSGSTYRSRRQDDYRNAVKCDLIIASGEHFKDLIQNASSTLIDLIYKDLGTENRKERLEALLSLESALTKKLRSNLSDEDKELLKDSTVKKTMVSKKRTWFPEVIVAIQQSNLEEFRRLITADYPLSKFLSDAKNKTNSSRLGNIHKRLNLKFWLNLTNEELFTLKRLYYYTYSDLTENQAEGKITVDRKWSDSDLEILTDSEKVACIGLTKDPEELLQYLAKNKAFKSEGISTSDRFEGLVSFAFKLKRGRYDSTKITPEVAEKYNYAFDIIRPDASFLQIETIAAIIKKRSKNESLEILKDVIKDYSLEALMSLTCKEGSLVKIKDSLPLDPKIIRSFEQSYSPLGVVKSLKELGLVEVATLIAKAYVSKNYKEDLPKIGLRVPDRRKDVQEIIEFLGVQVTQRGEKSTTATLRAMKSVVRECNSTVIESIIEKFKPEEVRTAVLKSWNFTGGEINVPLGDFKSFSFSNLDNLMKYCGLECIISGVATRYGSLNREEISAINKVRGLTNVRFDQLPLTFGGYNSVVMEPSFANSFTLSSSSLRDVAVNNKANFMNVLEGFNIEGEGANLLNSMDPNEIISEFNEEAAIYILGEKGMLTLKRFIQIQDQRMKITEIIAEELAEYVSSKLGIEVGDVPFLYQDDAIGEVKCLNTEDSVMLSAKLAIDDFTKGDRAIDLKHMSSRKKLELINYAMKAWNIAGNADPSQINLEDMNSLDFWTLESFKNLDVKALAKIFGFREDDKKSIQRVRDLLATKGLDVIRKAIMMRELWVLVLGDSAKITLDDTIGSEESNAFCVEYHTEIQDLLNALNSSAIARKFILISHMSAGKLRDWIKSGESYFKDTFEVVEKIIITNDSISATTAKAIGVSATDYNSIKSSSDNALNSLKSVIKNSDFSLIHDIVMKLVSVGDKEMLAVENQGHYEKLEKKEASEALGYSLFFPKIYSDTHALGTQNGWCVSSSRIYSQNVREGKAILVGISPKGNYGNKEAAIEAVESLLYVLFDKRGDVSSYEIKFSNRMSTDLSKKMPMDASRKDTIGQQKTPPSERYPVNEIIRLVRKIRADLEKDDKLAA